MKNIVKLMLALWATLAISFAAFADDGKKGTYTEVKTPPSTAQMVKVGFYPISVYQLDMSSNTYYVDMYVWFRWKGDINPIETLEFTNMVEEWGKQQEALLETPKVLADGSKYQIVRVEGRFVQPFSLINFPLDRQKLSIMVEDTTNGVETVSYEIDRESSGIGKSLDIPGWILDGWTAKTYAHNYGSQFGEEGTPTVYSALAFNLEISRPISFFFWALLFPLFIVLIAALAALNIKPNELDVRTGLPAGALLTAIFLQKSYADDLPELGYLILMDQIYLVAYALIVFTLVRSIYAYKVVSAINDENDARFKSVQKADRGMFIAQILLFAAAVAAIISFGADS
ncbi:MAG: hypothetical protein ACK4ZE_09710 [Sphingorhabdus sp.]